MRVLRPALASVAFVTLAVSLASAKRLPPPPGGKSLTCKSQMSFNHESASIVPQRDGVHVVLAADHKLSHWWKLTKPKDKANRVLRDVLGAGTLELVFPAAGCQFGKDAGLVACTNPGAPLAATLTYPDRKGKQTNASYQMTAPSMHTARIDTATVEASVQTWRVTLEWGGTSTSGGTAEFTFEMHDTCTAQ